MPIQVVGVLESAQLEFDHLWVLGLSDDTWPRPARPNPLLPLELQRSRGVPRASAEWELAFARRAQAEWLRAAPTWSSATTLPRATRPSPARCSPVCLSQHWPSSPLRRASTGGRPRTGRGPEPSPTGRDLRCPRARPFGVALASCRISRPVRSAPSPFIAWAPRRWITRRRGWTHATAASWCMRPWRNCGRS